jgi:hypothetical protein
MKWDAIGAIAELLGAIGVIASLVYLASQIRQSREQMTLNSRTVQASTQQKISENLNGIVMRATADSENARAIALGSADFAKLEGEDLMRFQLWAGGLLTAYENAYYQYRIGLLDENRWRLYHAQLISVLSPDRAGGPGIADYWRAYPLTTSPEFVALVEEILGEEGGDE